MPNRYTKRNDRTCDFCGGCENHGCTLEDGKKVIGHSVSGPRLFSRTIQRGPVGVHDRPATIRQRRQSKWQNSPQDNAARFQRTMDEAWTEAKSRRPFASKRASLE